jgi:hypothetical protein
LLAKALFAFLLEVAWRQKGERGQKELATMKTDAGSDSVNGVFKDGFVWAVPGVSRAEFEGSGKVQQRRHSKKETKDVKNPVVFDVNCKKSQESYEVRVCNRKGKQSLIIWRHGFKGEGDEKKPCKSWVAEVGTDENTYDKVEKWMISRAKDLANGKTDAEKIKSLRKPFVAALKDNAKGSLRAMYLTVNTNLFPPVLTQHVYFHIVWIDLWGKSWFG